MRRASTIAMSLLAALTLAALVGCGAGTGRTGASTPIVVPPVPTYTPGPPTPTPTAFELHLAAIAQPAIGTLATNVTATFNPTTSAATVIATINPDPSMTVPAVQELVKTVCFLGLKALWTSGAAVKDVDVGVLGPFQDDFGNHILSAYASADVTAKTAATLQWASLTPDTAWNAYTYVFLAPTYAAGQYWGRPTPTPYPTV